MAMRLSSYVNRTAGAGVDRAGKIFIELADVLVAGGNWKWVHQGDGISMYSSSNARAFTSHGGDGYINNNTNWGVNTGGANSFSNQLAYYVLAELDDIGLPTGRQMLVQRTNSTNFTIVNVMKIAFSWTGFTGAASATAAPSGGTFQVLTGGTINGSGGTDIFTGLTVSSYYIQAAGTVTYQIWDSDEPSGESGDVSPFMLGIYSAAGTNDFAGVLVYEAMVGATGDVHPCIAGWGTWDTMFGETISSTPGSFGVTPLLYTADAVGAISTSGFAPLRLPNSGTTASASATIAGGSSDTSLFPAFVFVDGAGAPIDRGRCETLVHYVPTTNSYCFPHTAFASVAHGSEPPRLLCGRIAAPWQVGVVPSSASAVVNRTDLRTIFPDAPTVDGTAPVFSAFSPAPGAIAFDQALTIDITDNLDELDDYVITIEYASLPDEVAWNGDSWSSDYDAASGAATITGGARVTIKRDAGWPAAFTIRIKARDQDNNADTTTGAYTLSSAATPTVTNISPASASSIGLTTAVTFRTSDLIGLSVTRVTATFAGGQKETVWDGSFADLYVTDSTRTEVSAGKTYDFSIRRSLGWRDAFVLTVYLVDSNLNELTQNLTYTLSATPGPSISNVVPADGATIAATDAVDFDVAGTSAPLRLVTVTADFASGTTEVIYDGDGFTSKYSGSSTGSITNGTSFSVLRSGGWSSDVTINVTAVDEDGQLAAASFDYTVTGAGVSSAPVVGPFTPADGTPITASQAISFPITDTSGNFAIRYITAFFPSTGAWEVVWGNNKFAPWYSSSTRSAISGGHTYAVRRSLGGWPATPKIIIDVADAEGFTN